MIKKNSLKAPFFIQGVTVLTFTGSMLYTLSWANKVLGVFEIGLPVAGTWSYAITYAILTLIASGFGFWLFSSKKRIASNLFIEKNLVELNYRPLIVSSLSLCIMVFVFSMPFPFGKDKLIPTLVSLFVAINIIVISYDIFVQWKLTLKNKKVISLCEMDNVYYACVLSAKLNEACINHCIQGFQYRRLYYFFQPFIKMKVLICEDDKQRATEQMEYFEIGFI
ncbi:MAG: hypothetical protein ISR65_09085 [Bacteriovoracaceae bacterium]|nr:hypothetical protein [Bacteriovoracaceae bacterium]